MNDLTIYKKYKEYMKTGDLLLYSSKGQPIGWAIQVLSGGPWNHASGIRRPGPDISGIDRLWTFSADAGGVRESYLSDVLSHYHGEVWWYPLRDEFEDRRPLMDECFLALKGRKYDFKSLFRLAVATASLNMRRLFCSEYYQVALQYAKVIEFLEKALRPNDLSKLEIYNIKHIMRIV